MKKVIDVRIVEEPLRRAGEHSPKEHMVTAFFFFFFFVCVRTCLCLFCVNNTCGNSVEYYGQTTSLKLHEWAST